MRQKKEKIKICVVSYFIYPLFNKKSHIPFGGAEVQLYLLLKEFSKEKKYDLNVITSDLISKKKCEIHDNIKVHVSIPYKKKPIDVPLRLFYKLCVLDPDIVIQRAAGIPTRVCALYCSIFNKKFIYSISHEIDVNGTAEQGIFGKFFKYGLRKANIIVAQNNDQKKILKKRNGNNLKNIKVIRSGYEIKETQNLKENFILWVGKAVNWKRPNLFLKLAEQLRDEKFVMIINKRNDLDLWNEILNKANRLKNLILIPQVHFSLIDDYFKKAKIFINTSIHEGFPNTFIQALKNRTPIVSLNVNPDNFLNIYKCGFYCEDDFSQLLKNIKELLYNKKLYEDFSKNAYFYAKNNHDLKMISSQWKQLINYLYNVNNIQHK